jgi:hypothetical protein
VRLVDSREHEVLQEDKEKDGVRPNMPIPSVSSEFSEID